MTPYTTPRTTYPNLSRASSHGWVAACLAAACAPRERAGTWVDTKRKRRAASRDPQYSVSGAGQELLDARRKCVHVDRLGDEAHAAGLEGIPPRLQACMRRHRHHGYRRGRRHALQQPGQRQAVLSGQLDVHEDQRRLERLQAFEGLSCRACHLDLIAVELEDLACQQLIGGIVFDDQDQRLRFHVPLSVASVLAGPGSGAERGRKARTWPAKVRVSIGLDM